MSKRVRRFPTGAPSRARIVMPLQAHRLICGDLGFDCGGEVRRVRKNSDVIVAGRHYDTLFMNHDGWLCRYKVLHDGDHQIVDFILPGQVFGIQACMFKTSLYSVATITEASLSPIALEAVDGIFERAPALAKALFWSAVCQSAILAEHLIDAARRSAYERVGHLLLELFARLNASGRTEGMSFEMPLTQELIGGALGLTTVHVNRTFRALREDRLIAVDGRRITILDFESLCLVADFDNSYLGEIARALRGETAASDRRGGTTRVASRERAPLRSSIPPRSKRRIASAQARPADRLGPGRPADA